MDVRTRSLATLLLTAGALFTMGCAAHRYDAYGNHYYEGYDHPHATEGAILGGLAGAGVGRAIAGHHHDEAGYWIGGALGALTGAVIGDAMDRDEARIREYGDPPPPSRHDGYDRYDEYDRHDGRDGRYDSDDRGRDRDHRRDHSAHEPPAEPAPLFLSLPDEVLFAPGSDRLESGAKRRLRAVAKALRSHPGTVAVVRGHASRQETTQLGLSDARARAVREYLVGRGIAPSRVTALGLGARFPVASDRTAEGQQRNRRAEIELHTDRGPELAGLW